MPTLSQACLRHAIHYQLMARKADHLYHLGGETMKAGLRLFDAEWENIQFGQARAAAHASKDQSAARCCSAYPLEAPKCLSLRRDPKELLQWAQAGLSSARQLADRHAEARHLANLGEVYSALGESNQAIELFDQALALARAPDVFDRKTECNALCYIGNTHLGLRRSRQALECYQEWLAIAREIGDRMDEGTALGNIGVVYMTLGEHSRAIEFYGQRLVITREIGDLRGESDTLENLAIIHFESGNRPIAFEFFNGAVAFNREIGNRLGEVGALTNLGNAHASSGMYREAHEMYAQCLRIAREIGDRKYESTALWSTAVILDRLGNRAQAIECADAALKILDETKSPDAQRMRTQLAVWRRE